MDIFLGKPKTSSAKGTKSKTHKGRLNYTTKKGDKVFHQKNHYVKKSRKPYMIMGGKKYGKGTRSKTHPGRIDYTTKKGDKVFHRKNHYVRKSRKPFIFF